MCFLGAVGPHPEGQSKMFRRWTKSLVQADRVIQERANYRYTLARIQINREKLAREVRAERCSSVMSTRSPRGCSPLSLMSTWTRDPKRLRVFRHHRTTTDTTADTTNATILPLRSPRRGRTKWPG